MSANSSSSAVLYSEMSFLPSAAFPDTHWWDQMGWKTGRAAAARGGMVE